MAGMSLPEVASRHCRDACFVQQLVRKIVAVPAELTDVRVNVESPVGFGRNEQPQTFKRGKQIVATLLEGLPAVFVDMHDLRHEAGQSRVPGKSGSDAREAGGRKGVGWGEGVAEWVEL